MHITTNEGKKPRKNMAQDLRNKDPTQESSKGNSQDSDEEKFQDFHTDSQGSNWSRQEQEDRGLQEKNRTDKFPDVFEYIARSLNMFVARISDATSKTN